MNHEEIGAWLDALGAAIDQEWDDEGHSDLFEELMEWRDEMVEKRDADLGAEDDL